MLHVRSIPLRLKTPTTYMYTTGPHSDNLTALWSVAELSIIIASSVPYVAPISWGDPYQVAASSFYEADVTRLVARDVLPFLSVVVSAKNVGRTASDTPFRHLYFTC